MQLYSYWRSSAAYRVRIALNLKSIHYETVTKRLAANEHRAAAYLAVNPQGLIPALDDDGFVVSQSMAIIEYLDETHREPALLPADARGRAVVRAMAHGIVCDLHPLNNLRVLNYLKQPLGHDPTTIERWYRHWVGEGLSGLEQLARRHSADGRHLYGTSVSLADICLVPQLYNARRFRCDLEPYPTLAAIGAALEALPPFQAARPEAQPDAG